VPGAGVEHGDHVILHNGNIVKTKGKNSYYGSFSKILILNRGVHEPLEEFVFQQVIEFLKKYNTEHLSMLELGVYWGHYSMWLKHEFPGPSVFLVEPSAKNLDCGKYNFCINGYQGEFLQSKVGDSGLQVDTFCLTQELKDYPFFTPTSKDTKTKC
jgi:hypothetical protein